MDTGEVCWTGSAANCCPSGPDGGQQLCESTLLGVSRCFGTTTIDTCLPDGAGHDALCGVFTDPEFDPGQRAVYYARIVEAPSCRWK